MVVSFDVYDDRVKVRFVSDSHDVTPLSPHTPGQFVTDPMRRELLDPAGDRLASSRITRARTCA